MILPLPVRICCVLVSMASALLAAKLDLRFSLDQADQPTRAKITRTDYLLSGFALQKSDGTWLESSDELIAFISHQKQRERAALGEIPPDEYQAVRFRVGLSKEKNHLDPNQIPPEHPLHPSLNNLHWTWQEGYIFFAIEGYSTDELGFSYHLGNDGNSAEVVLTASIDTNTDRTISIALNVEKVLAGIDLARQTSTHSREGDPLPAILQKNLSSGFRVTGNREGVFRSHQSTEAIPAAPGTTPFPDFIAEHLPEVTLPLDNPLTREGVNLGRLLFHSPILSKNQNISCANCHVPELAFTDSARLSFGTHSEAGRRHSMPLFNLAWHKEMFWDGRAKSLRDQIHHPIEDPLEMDLPLDEALKRLNDHTRYPEQFEKAFGTREITADLLVKALEQFLLTIVSQDSRFDDALLGKVEFTEQEKRGFELFITEHDPANGLKGADCFHCHGGPLLTNHSFANNGLDYEFKDLGHGESTKNIVDKGKFKVPSLRNIAITGPYMHDGRFNTLEEVIEHYNSGVKRSPTLDPNLAKHPELGLDLTAEDKAALLAFLQTLTDKTYTKATR